MNDDITLAYEALKKLEFSLPESALNVPIDNGDYNINHLLDAQGYQELVQATERLMSSARDNHIDLARVEGFCDVRGYYNRGSDDKIEPAEAMAYLVACAYAVNTRFKDGKVVSIPEPSIHPEQMTPEQKLLAVEIARQVLGDTFPKYSKRDTSTDASMKSVINAARAVQNKENELLAKAEAKRQRDNTLVK